MRFLPLLIALLSALPATAQGALTMQPVAISFEGQLAHWPDGNGETAVGIGVGAVYRAFGVTGFISPGTEAGIAVGGGVEVYPLREMGSGQPGTLAVGLAVSYADDGRDPYPYPDDGGTLALTPSLRAAVRALEVGRVVLIPQVSLGLAIPFGDGEDLPSFVTSASLAVGVGTESTRVFVGPTLGYTPSVSGGLPEYMVSVSLGAAFGFSD